MMRIAELISIPSDESEVRFEKKEQNFALFEMQGLRPTQEDAAVAYWYTAGSFNALTAQDIGHRLWTSYKLINQHCLKRGFGGSTASTTVYDGEGNLITATLGDSVVFVVVYFPNGHVASVARLNKAIHHPNLDQERLTQVRGLVKNGRLLGRYGSLALSRALGDYDFIESGVCDDAHIDITPSDFTHASGMKTQIITTCDGFTEPVPGQTKENQEQWFWEQLQSIDKPGLHSEAELARLLAYKAFHAGSRDNISVSVQVLTKNKPFLVGIYDGHGGDSTSTYIANAIGTVFEQQCSLKAETYAEQPLSVEKNWLIYSRDNH
ncbi:MAG: PP2C family serine/threonine-protein phosphatase [Legionella sp.]|uniref:PP2C family serine/threonine-protein phosphatase n=1 Tax=Legionella sp. TaxID=459 RepID=UPI0028474434|nr:PP2C family serine/threonine-protein phosphatase [Legionella sp.]